MEIKATLNKPYDEIDKLDFIVTNNHQLGYEIKETETALEAWGLTEEENLTLAKKNKYSENDEKAKDARYNQEFTITVQEQECVFDTSAQTQADLLTAFAVCSTGETYDGWVTNNGVELDLTLEDVALISNTFKELSNVYGKWNQFKELIDAAQTVADVQAIDIDYNESEEQE